MRMQYGLRASLHQLGCVMQGLKIFAFEISFDLNICIYIWWAWGLNSGLYHLSYTSPVYSAVVISEMAFRELFAQAGLEPGSSRI
jgi:hypothetical protein